MGLSSRPSADLLASPPSTPIAARVARAEHFFVDSLESWRIAVGVERMLLIGHSLGGYLSAAYSVRYPERLSGLILMSPAGIPRGPKYRADKPEGEKNEGNEDEAVDAAEMEVDQDQAEVKGKTKEPEPQDKGSFLKRTGMKGTS